MNKILQNENTAPAGSDFARKMLNASMSTVEVVGENIVRKTYKRNQFPEPERWLKSYNQLRAWDYRYIKVHKVSNDYIEMDYVDGGIHLIDVLENNTNHTVDEKMKIITDFIDILSLSYGYISQSNEVFLHTDLSLTNVLVDSDNQLIVIDPDACGYEARQDKGLSNLIYVHHNAMHKYYRLLSYKKFANEN